MAKAATFCLKFHINRTHPSRASNAPSPCGSHWQDGGGQEQRDQRGMYARQTEPAHLRSGVSDLTWPARPTHDERTDGRTFTRTRYVHQDLIGQHARRDCDACSAEVVSFPRLLSPQPWRVVSRYFHFRLTSSARPSKRRQFVDWHFVTRVFFHRTVGLAVAKRKATPHQDPDFHFSSGIDCSILSDFSR